MVEKNAKIQLSFDKQVDRFAYSSTNVLGQGSYGKVVLGYDTINKKLVAVKIINLSTIMGSNSQ
jgi:serine/threonine protein kinase